METSHSCLGNRVLPLIVLAAYGYRSLTPSYETQGLDGAWRVFLGLGAVVPLSVFYFRWRMVTSSAFEHYNVDKYGGFSWKIYLLIARRYWKRLLGTCLCWFL